MHKKIYILDSSAFINKTARKFLGEPTLTVYEVEEELKTIDSKIEYDLFLKQGLIVTEPTPESIKKINEILSKTNDKLSKTDIKVVALALDYKNKGKDVVVVSDDYAVQNVCKFLNIEFLSTSFKGIKNQFVWIKVCKVCGSKTEEDVCPKCGHSDFKFVPRKSNSI